MGWLKDWKRRRVLARHRIDDALWDAVVAPMPFLRGFAREELQRLRELALVFLAEKQFSGAHGLRLDDAMRLSIAVQACLPVLNLGLDRYDEWSEVVVYPGDFKVRITETDDEGVVHEFDDERAGESWRGGERAGHERGDPRVRAQARHGRRRSRRHAAAALRDGPARMDRSVSQRL
jgi:Mlc titration factor MtfA (ptsG expression regulator)